MGRKPKWLVAQEAEEAAKQAEELNTLAKIHKGSQSASCHYYGDCECFNRGHSQGYDEGFDSAAESYGGGW